MMRASHCARIAAIRPDVIGRFAISVTEMPTSCGRYLLELAEVPVGLLQILERLLQLAGLARVLTRENGEAVVRLEELIPQFVIALAGVLAAQDDAAPLEGLANDPLALARVVLHVAAGSDDPKPLIAAGAGEEDDDQPRRRPKSACGRSGAPRSKPPGPAQRSRGLRPHRACGAVLLRLSSPPYRRLAATVHTD